MNRIPELESLYLTIDDARSQGEQHLADGTHLIGRAPDIAPQAWMHILFEGLSQAELAVVQRSIGRTVPESLAKFLTQSNGLSLFSDALFIAGLRRGNRRNADPPEWQPFSIERLNTTERHPQAMDYHVIVGGYGGDGSLLYIDSRDGSANRCSWESIRPVQSWRGLFEMLSDEAVRIAALWAKRPLGVHLVVPPLSSKQPTRS